MNNKYTCPHCKGILLIQDNGVNHVDENGVISELSPMDDNGKRKFPVEYDTPKRLVFKNLNERRGYPSRQPGAEAQAICQMLVEGFKATDILRAYDLMKKREFFKDKNLSMMQVRKDIHEVLRNHQPKVDPDKYIHGRYGHMVRR